MSDHTNKEESFFSLSNDSDFDNLSKKECVLKDLFT